MPDLNLSLAPSRLTQTINPWTFSLGSLFTINLGKSGDTELETRMLDEVGSYGRQIGRLGDALGVLVAIAERTGELKSLSPTDQAAIGALRKQLGDVDRIKRERAVELHHIKT
jgi:hypothetical protein